MCTANAFSKLSDRRLFYWSVGLLCRKCFIADIFFSLCPLKKMTVRVESLKPDPTFSGDEKEIYYDEPSSEEEGDIDWDLEDPLLSSAREDGQVVTIGQTELQAQEEVQTCAQVQIFY